MSNCCGARRAEFARSGQRADVPRAAAPAGQAPDVRLRLDRPLDLTLRGRVTGRDYHFTPAIRSLRVAAADVDGLLREGGLTREG